MKKFKRLTAVLAAALMAVSLSVPCAAASATSDNTLISQGNITIFTEEKGHTYKAYQIFDGNVSKDASEKVSISNVTWGSGTAADILLDSDSTNPILIALKSFKASNGSKPFENCTDAASVAAVLSTIASNTDKNTSTDIDEIAAIFAKNTSTTATASTDTFVTDTDTATAGNQGGYVITITDPGYYLVIDDNTGAAFTDGQAYSKYILLVSGENTSIYAKSSAPTLVKKVKENDSNTVAGYNYDKTDTSKVDAQYNDVADYNIGDVIDFKLYGTLPSNFDLYTSYQYTFTDTYDTSFTPVDSNNDGTVDVTVKIDGNTVSSGYTVAQDTSNHRFTVTFNDLKNLTVSGTTISANSLITVEYQAMLNSSAAYGQTGNTNSATLTYSNDPNSTAETGTTPGDSVVVFTYQLDITKYLGDMSTKATADNGKKAGFKLYNSENKVAIFDDNNIFTGWVNSLITDGVEANGTEITTDANGKLSFKGLDEGTYTLAETTTPTGYNTMEGLTLKIAATTQNGQNYMDTESTDTAAEMLTALTLTEAGGSLPVNGDLATGTVSTDIINQKGPELPSTGGIGTTIFYVSGGILVAVAGVFLIVKKRMSKKDD